MKIKGVRFVLVMCFIFVVNGCAGSSLAVAENYGSIEMEVSVETKTTTLVFTSTPSPIAMLVPTPTIVSSFTPTPIQKFEHQRQKIKELMKRYEDVQEYYLSDDYWNLLYQRIEKFGTAEKIAALELHGNNYNMYNGGYSLSPESFYIQIDYLMKNEYHFVTIHELEGFLEGWLDLPKRSIILTSDSGNPSRESNTSIIEQFSDLTLKYGYRPHIQSYIWTFNMTADESSKCKDDACWESFRDAMASGFFTFGTHSESHHAFEFETPGFLYEDLKQSIDEIYDNLGIRVYAITWPHESCSREMEILNNLGITIGFGGLSKPERDSFVYKEDAMNLCLPRLFPPNSGNINSQSSRPYGFTLQDILDLQMKSK
jgi:hypothetical protein